MEEFKWLTVPERSESIVMGREAWLQAAQYRSRTLRAHISSQGQSREGKQDVAGGFNSQGPPTVTYILPPARLYFP